MCTELSSEVGQFYRRLLGPCFTSFIKDYFSEFVQSRLKKPIHYYYQNSSFIFIEQRINSIILMPFRFQHFSFNQPSVLSNLPDNSSTWLISTSSTEHMAN